MVVDQQQIDSNQKKILERKLIFKRYGYDQDVSRNFILEKCLPIYNPVLEVGTGKGHMAVLLAKYADVITIDISKDEQKAAQLNARFFEILHKIHFVACDAGKLPYKDLYFGLVVSVNAFHHFEEPFAVLSEMIRVCKSKLVISDFNQEGFNIVRKVHNEEGGTHEEQCGDFSIVGAYLKEHGFSVKSYDGHHQKIYVANRIK